VLVVLNYLYYHDYYVWEDYDSNELPPSDAIQAAMSCFDKRNVYFVQSVQVSLGSERIVQECSVEMSVKCDNRPSANRS
jgi:hypothetical protein